MSCILRPVLVVLIVLSLCVVHKTASGDNGTTPRGRSTRPSAGIFPIVKDRKLGFIDQHGQLAVEPQFDLPHVRTVDKWYPVEASCLANRADRIADYDTHYALELPTFHEGVMPVVKNGRAGYIRQDGQLIAEPIYYAVGAFIGGVAWVIDENKKYSMLDSNGRVLIQGVDAVGGFREGIAPIRVGDRWGAVDQGGRQVITPHFDSISSFSNGVACAMEGNRYWLINRGGERVAPAKGRCSSFSEGLAIMEQDSRVGYINLRGEIVIPSRFNQARPFREGLAAVLLERKWGFVDRKGEWSVPPLFDDVKDFSNGMAAVCVGSKSEPLKSLWGLIDSTGAYVVKPQYSAIYDWHDGRAIVTAQGYGHGVIDMRGVIVVEPRFVDLEFVGNSRLLAMREGGDAIIDYAGRLCLEFESSRIYPVLSDGLRRINRGGRFGYVDEWGRMAIPTQFEFADDYDRGLARVAVGVRTVSPAGVSGAAAWGYIDTSGNWVWKPTR